MVPITTEDHDVNNSTGVVEKDDDEKEMEDTEYDQTNCNSSDIVHNDDEEQIEDTAAKYVVGVASSSSTVSLVVSTMATLVIVLSRLIL